MTINTHPYAKAESAVSRDHTVNQHLLAGQPAFLGYLRRRLGSLDEAEDALQNFSLKVICAAQSLGREEKIKAWMGQILRHTLIDHYRRRAVRQRAEAAYAQQARIADATPEAAQSGGPCHCLQAALPQLRADYAAILRRADLDEEPRARIAADLGLTTNALNVRLHRARIALKHELQASCPACRTASFLQCDCA